MNIYDLQFDAGQGEIKIDEAGGVATFEMSESNPRYPGGAKFQVPLNPIIDAYIAKLKADGSLKSKLEAWGLGIVETEIDQTT